MTSRYGPDKSRRMLRCRTCKARFSERKGTPLFDAHLPPEKVESVLEHVAEGCGVRQTGRLCRVEPQHRRPLQPPRRRARPRRSTTSWWLFPPGPARSSSMRSGRSSPRRRSNCDRDDPADDRKGDCWDHVALRPRAPAGRRASCPASGRPRTPRRWSGTSSRRTGRPADEPDDQRRLPGLRDGDPGRLRRDGHAAPDRQAGPAPGPVQGPAAGADLRDGGRSGGRRAGWSRSARGWSSARSRRCGGVGRCRRSSRAINTAFVERQNGTDRHRNARKVRKTYRFSKDWRYHEAVTYFTLYSYNFCWPVRTLRDQGRGGPLAETEPGDGGGADRSRLVDVRVVVTAPPCSIVKSPEILRRRPIYKEPTDSSRTGSLTCSPQAR